MCALSGLPEPVWAAALPVNAERPVGQLVDDVYGDHAVMVSAVCSVHSI